MEVEEADSDGEMLVERDAQGKITKAEYREPAAVEKIPPYDIEVDDNDSSSECADSSLKALQAARAAVGG
eukprot:13377883-Alexandrium_andersonii.AAC.1